MNLNTNPSYFNITSETVVETCGKPYAVCVAETPEEAKKLYEFMQQMRNETVEPDPESADEWSIQDSYGECAGEYESYDEAHSEAVDWCYMNCEDGYTVEILHNGNYYDEVSCKIEVG